jgi:hypothetical protein
VDVYEYKVSRGHAGEAQRARGVNKKKSFYLRYGVTPEKMKALAKGGKAQS